MSQRTSAPDSVFELAARKSARRRAYDARCEELHQRQHALTARLYAAAHYRVSAGTASAEFVQGWASTFVDAAGALTDANLWRLVQDDPHDTWISRRLAYAALCAARDGLEPATDAAKQIFADTNHRDGVRSALDDLVGKVARALYEAHAESLRTEFPDEAPAAKYDPCEREPATFAELCEFAAFWACFARPDFDSKGRAPVVVHDPDYEFLVMYCQAEFGEMSLAALGQLRNRYAVQTGKSVEAINATSLRDLANHFRPERAKSEGNSTGNEKPKPKKSTQPGEAHAKLVAALTMHHRYADGGALNLDPIGNNELARLAGVDPSTASKFFTDQFEGLARYKRLCLKAAELAYALKLLNGEVAPKIMYNDSAGATVEDE
jgi:hypothetical protein